MAEIQTPPTITYDDQGDEVITFTSSHTLSDIVRWLMTNPVDAEEVHGMLGDELLKASKPSN
jgi:hypothetical protein